VSSGITKDAQVIIISPLTRCLQTCSAFDGYGIPVEVVSMCTEQNKNACDIGRRSDELAKEFSDYNFKGVPPNQDWWYTDSTRKGGKEPDDSLEKRVEEFRNFLLVRDESKIVVIGHSIFFAKLLNRTLNMNNCEIEKVILNVDGTLSDAPEDGIISSILGFWK